MALKFSREAEEKAAQLEEFMKNTLAKATNRSSAETDGELEVVDQDKRTNESTVVRKKNDDFHYDFDEMEEKESEEKDLEIFYQAVDIAVRATVEGILTKIETVAKLREKERSYIIIIIVTIITIIIIMIIMIILQ